MKEWTVVHWLLSFIKNVKGKVLLAVTLGIISNLAVVAIPLIGLREVLLHLSGQQSNPWRALGVMLLCGVIRGIARYIEQYLNHDIAFRLLATIRERIFATIRTLGPAKLSGKKSGDLVTAITSDVEALEVFFAHTVSPVLIALGTTLITVGFLWQLQPMLAAILLLGQLLVGVLIPIVGYKKSRSLGDAYQESFVALNQTVMEDINSLQDISQYGLEKERLTMVETTGKKLNQQYQKKLKQESLLRLFSEGVLLVTAISLFLVGTSLQLPVSTVFTSVILGLSSFGSVLALSGLGSALVTTFASARRLVTLTQEIPAVTFSDHTLPPIDEFSGAIVDDVTFSYNQQLAPILSNLSLPIPQEQIIGIGGESGNGKSTLVKLLMRYWDPEKGTIGVGSTNLRHISETDLHNLEGVMEQKTFIFDDTLAANIGLGNAQASQSAIEVAAKQVAIHDWILSLPEQYETKIGGLHRSLSDGERQRIGMARLFLHDAPFILLDEPTSNLDYLNEQAILHSLKKGMKQKTVLLISHRETTLRLADQQYELANGQLTVTSK